MNNEKKCPNCKKWSAWKNELSDRCEHCGEVLSPLELENHTEKTEREKKQREEWLFGYAEDAPFYVKIYKKMGQYIYAVIMAIVSFIMWLFLWLGP